MPRTPDPATRTALIEAAAHRLAADGPDALSLRAVAAEARTTTQAIYTHFGSKDDLVEAVVTEAFARLLARQLAVPETDDPLADLRALAAAYRANALANAHLYRVMFGLNPSGLTDPSRPLRDHPGPLAQAGLDAFGVLAHHVERAVASGAIRGDAGQVALSLWSATHGVVSLELAGYLDGTAADDVFVATLDALVLGLAER